MAQNHVIQPSTPPPEFETTDPTEDGLLRVLDLASKTLAESGIEHGMIGGIASAALGRPRWTHDIDFFMRPEDAHRALTALERKGFLTHETNPNWIFKALKDGVLVDILFRAKRELYFDEEMAARCRRVQFKGVLIRTVPPEDLIMIKAVIHDEDTPRHWFDALEILAVQEIDWDYFHKRALSAGPRRALALLAYAQSIDIAVPDSAVVRLAELAYPSAAF